MYSKSHVLLFLIQFNFFIPVFDDFCAWTILGTEDSLGLVQSPNSLYSLLLCSVFEIHFHFISTVVLPACLSVHHECAGDCGGRRGHWIPLNWNCRLLWAAMWLLGIKPRSPGRAAILLTPEPFFQSPADYNSKECGIRKWNILAMLLT